MYIELSRWFVYRMMRQVRRRVKALKKLQLEATNLEAKFYEEVFIDGPITFNIR